MRIKLLLLMVIAAVMPVLAQTASLTGTVTDASTGQPVSGATVMLRDQGLSVTTGAAGDFKISNARPGSDLLLVLVYGYNDADREVTVPVGGNVELGRIALTASGNMMADLYEEQADQLFDESALDDEESSAQAIAALTGASDNIYYSAASYNFSPMYFNMRGYDSQYQTTYINGFVMNDPIRGRFNYSSLGGMTSRAFRNRTTSIGLQASAVGMGGIGGSTSISTITADYAPGFNGSLAYTNSNYMLRAMATYATGINSHGWGVTVSAIGRYANEGVVDGTFYNSIGLFLSVEKEINKAHSLTLSLYGAPTQRAAARATVQEAYDLAGDNLYNPSWGWYEGKKRSDNIREQFDPTAMLNWIYKAGSNTTLNTGVMYRMSFYNSTRIERLAGSDPRPDYFHYLPSYYYNEGEPTMQSEFLREQWRTNEDVRQINWNRLYEVNALNNYHNTLVSDPSKQLGSDYILENRWSNLYQTQVVSVLNHRLNSVMSLQAGVSAAYSLQQNYKTVRDLLGGEFWVDLDGFSDREVSRAPDQMQNDLDNPNRRVGEGDKFGYNYDYHVYQVRGWLQNTINTAHWDVNYGLELNYTQFQRNGHMRNGRSPQNSKGYGQTHRFDNGAFKAGATYKLDGRNYFMLNAEYGTKAPNVYDSYISPRVKDDAVAGLQSERILSADLTYGWSYRRFRGSVTGFATEINGATEKTMFYDDTYATNVNYVMTGVRRVYKGVEIGMAFKILPSLTLSAAGTVASYRYKNNPMGTRNFDNGARADTTQTVYLKNMHVGGTPQTAFNVGLDWAAPKSWFFNVNASWMRDAYVSLAPRYHEALPDLWQSYPTEEELLAKIREISTQPKMNNAFVLNASIGKVIYINRKMSLNINLNLNNITNNRNIMTNAYQQGRLDNKNWDVNRYPYRLSYAQGFKAYLNVGIRF